MKIKFDHNYPKLHGQKHGILLDVRRIRNGKAGLYQEFIEYDTEIEPGKYYELPREEEDLIVLTFQGDKLIPFTTIRTYTPSKLEYYCGAVEEIFTFITPAQIPNP